ncbi:MAG TPA: sigma-70 family RNA polymerase sigma factor [Armatimonadota bacterium]|nr:sigma-70 family RNA polymerase sigma factor [Armatimonadota bacterium]HOM72593.1 sigma-70 family RNA polymerase sigma factor [Armatimonadota bacterium]HPP75784.1 sigma-70 family RNA polymerase sigma factor [Armatimonadota bacterium]
MQLPDEELAQRWKSGDLSAFETLFHRYERRVLNVALRMIGSLDDAEDVKQETFFRAHKSISGFRGGKFSTWLFKIAANQCLDRARRKSSKTASIDELVEQSDWQGMEDEQADPVTILIRNEFSNQVRKVLETIPPHYRIILVLKHIDGMPYEQIASVVGCSVRSLGVRLYRAREIFRERMRPFLDQNGGITLDEMQQRKISDFPAL